ncbi:alpha/beta fold hydrolase [Nonomuraea sp. NPDC004354]
MPQPTTSKGDVADLHALLEAARVPGPYVLVGWSAGGPIVRIYAGEYPHEVSGLVLVDAESEFLQSELTPEQFDTFLALIRNDDGKRVAQWKDVERQDPATVFDQVRAAPPPPRMPVVVLSGDTFDADAFRARLPAGGTGRLSGRLLAGTTGVPASSRPGVPRREARHEDRQRPQHPQQPATARHRRDSRCRRAGPSAERHAFTLVNPREPS